MVYKRVTEEIKLENIRMMWRNLRGEKKQFNEAGKRNFAIPLEEDLALQLAEIGWNVRAKEKANDEGKMETLYHLSVNVKLDGKNPPRIFMITWGPDGEPRRTQLDEDTVGLLDFAEFDNVDVIIRPYNYDFNGKKGVTHYLKTLFATLHVDDLEKKYAHIPIETAGVLEIEAGEDGDLIDVEGGEWIEDDEQPSLPRGNS